MRDCGRSISPTTAKENTEVARSGIPLGQSGCSWPVKRMDNASIVLMYHNIAKPLPGGGLRSLYVTPRMFAYQMWYLKTAGLRVVPLEEIAAGDDAPGRRRVALTFDDGFEDFYLNAWPVLRRYGFPSTVFLVSGNMGGVNTWDTDVGVTKKVLTWEQAAGMKGSGVSFGSHTVSHPFLSRLPEERIRTEVEASKREIEERLGVPADTFCYPFGDYDERVVRAVKAAGYRCGVTTRRGLVRSGDDPFEMRRSFIKLNTHPLLFGIKLHTRYEEGRGGR